MIRRVWSSVVLAAALLVAGAVPAAAGGPGSGDHHGPGTHQDHQDNAPKNLPTYVVDETKLPFDAVPGINSTREWGVLDGAGYQIEVPADWNGELVMWAHGFAGYEAELTVAAPPMRVWLLAHGFAWAASSYARNGYVVEQGARDTMKLAKFFAHRHGEPTRRYLTGVSMGGHITAYGIEHSHGFYDGALPACGVLGDHELFDYFQGFHALAQAITGVKADYPPAPTGYPTDTVPALVKALGGPTGPGYQTLAAAVQQLTGGTRVGFAVGFGSWFDFLMGLGAPPPGVAAFPSDNRDAVYQLDADPALSPAETALNAAVARNRRLDFPTPDGVWSTAPVKGDIDIPVLTMHTTGDLFVPFSMEQSYARKVAAHGAGDLLVQRAIRDVGHCSFSEAEFNRAMSDLVDWVHGGAKPAGDSVTVGLDAPTYGCAFSDNTGLFKGTAARATFAPCPAAAAS